MHEIFSGVIIIIIILNVLGSNQLVIPYELVVCTKTRSSSMPYISCTYRCDRQYLIRKQIIILSILIFCVRIGNRCEPLYRIYILKYIGRFFLFMNDTFHTYTTLVSLTWYSMKLPKKTMWFNIQYDIIKFIDAIVIIHFICLSVHEVKI